ncbi:unnamed protein product [Aureobasidium vineae]|uniref:Uncharacterized protein n=1 Tax=Aureobasidium vineae TaxID=2773715 RepID=A0A9N8JA31_9PEZI|nr:unnamed protein product [Aureobasidium vineae]
MNNRVPHHTTEQQAHQQHEISAEPRRLLPAPLAVEKDVIIICKTPNGQVNREYRFKRMVICRHSARIDDLCLRRPGSTADIIYVYVEHSPNLFAHYERWVRKSELPILDVTFVDQRDVLVLWINMYELAREMEDCRLVAAINTRIIDVAKLGSWSFYKRSVVDYLKKAPDGNELRQLLLDLHVARFESGLFKRYFWMLGPRLRFAIARRKMMAETPTMDGVEKTCAYHQHDRLYPWGDCGGKVVLTWTGKASMTLHRKLLLVIGTGVRLRVPMEFASLRLRAKQSLHNCIVA